MKTLNDYKKEYDKLRHKKNLKGKEALEAVKQYGYALRYVKEQTEEICLEAVKQNGDALQYVSEDMFKKEEDNEIRKTLELIKLLEENLEELKNFIK